MSRVFDEVMGLGDFAESSRGSATSSKSGSQNEAKMLDETSGQGENQLIEEDSNCSRQEEKTDDGEGESSFPRLTSSSSDQHSSFNMGTSERGGGGSGEAAFDDALDGLPSYGPEEDDEDWHFALPMGTLEDVDVDKANAKVGQHRRENNSFQGDPFSKPGGEENEEQEREESRGSANTSHSSQDNTPENSRGKASCVVFMINEMYSSPMPFYQYVLRILHESYSVPPSIFPEPPKMGENL